MLKLRMFRDIYLPIFLVYFSFVPTKDTKKFRGENRSETTLPESKPVEKTERNHINQEFDHPLLTSTIQLRQLRQLRHCMLDIALQLRHCMILRYVTFQLC